jgi:two-component system sensor histidine kinase PilS (NtrC family)
MPSTLLQAHATQQPDSYWRSLHYFNLFRLGIAGFFVVGGVVFGTAFPFGTHLPGLFFPTGVLYTMFAALMVLPINLRWPRFNLLLTMQVTADVAFITVLTYASGGIRSGLSLLLLGSLAATGMVSRGRLAMFNAALATIAVLLEEGYLMITVGADSGDFLQAGLTSMGYFATAGLAYVLTRRIIASERLAEEQSIDLANLAQVNQLVIQDMQDGVLVVDEQGSLRQLNARARRMLGINSLRPASSLAGYSPVLAARLQQWQSDPVAAAAPVRLAATGMQIRPRFIPVGQVRHLGVLIFLEDLSRLQVQAQQLKLAALGRLTASIAHEIRNPLSAISHATELLQEDHGEDPTQARLLQIIGDNTRRLEQMVAEVLQLNRRDRARPEIFSLADHLRAFADQFCQTEKLPPGGLVIQVSDGLGLSFDRNHFDQVLWNLCRNAWRHGRRQPGSVRLEGAAGPGGVVQLDVTDDGPGVPEELRPQLFEPFFTTDSKGTGLGLYIARELCEANGATLDYVEGAPGGRFRISKSLVQ